MRTQRVTAAFVCRERQCGALHEAWETRTPVQNAHAYALSTVRKLSFHNYKMLYEFPQNKNIFLTLFPKSHYINKREGSLQTENGR